MATTDLTPAARAANNTRIIRASNRKPRPDQRVIALSYMVENLAHLIPEARQLLRWRTNQANGYPAGNGEPSVSGGGGTTSVEAAVLTRTQAEADLDDIDDTIDSITVMVGDMTRFLRGITGRPAPAPDPLCCGGRGTEWLKLGSLIWGDDTCTARVHARGLCSKHYVAARRYALAKGIEWLDRTPTED